MKKLLITGFDPFGGGEINPSWEAVKLLPDRVGDYLLCKRQIPTVFGLAGERVQAEAELLLPEVILCVGQAGGRSAVTVERVAINVRTASIADNEGNRPVEESIISDGADGIFSTLPVVKMVEAIKNAGCPAAISNTAGSFVCNELLYTLLHRYKGTQTRVGFIHVPYLPQQGEPSLSLEEITRALAAAIAAI